MSISKVNSEIIENFEKRITKIELKPSQTLSGEESDKIKRELAFSSNRLFEIVIFGLSAQLVSDKIETIFQIARIISRFCGLAHRLHLKPILEFSQPSIKITVTEL